MSKQVNWDSLFTYDTLVHAISGAAGSVTAMSVCFPLDTVRSRLQVEDGRRAKKLPEVLKELIQEEGVETLYRGIVPVLQSVCCSNFVYFYSFHGLRALLASSNPSHMALKDLTLASIAGIINVILTTPLWVVNTRIKMQGANLAIRDKSNIADRPHYNGILDGLMKIYQSEGLAALWSGAMPSFILVLNPAIQFMIYEALKRQVEKRYMKPGALGFFLMGAIAKCISTVATYPLQLVQSRLRYGARDSNMMTMLFTLMLTKGRRGLYKGLEAKLYQTVLTAALMFLCYEKIASFVFVLLKGSRHS